MRLHSTPQLDLDATAPHGRHEVLPAHAPQDYELKCALKDEYGIPLPTAGVVTAEIVVEQRSLGWKIDGALVSGFGPAYRLDHARWSCEHADGTPAEGAAQRLFVVGLPLAEPARSLDEPGYELTVEHWSPGESRCAAAPLAGSASDGAWMCVRDVRYASCEQAACPEACGDGTCDAWETPSTCYSDCGPRVADLAVASIDCDRPIEAGGPVSCDVVLVNQGTVDTGEFDNQLWLSSDETVFSGGALLGGCRSAGLAAGSTSTVACNGTVPPATEADTWYLVFVADSSDAVVELDESNNLGREAVVVDSDYVPPADLVIPSVYCRSPSKLDEFECSVTVANIGKQDAGPFLVDLRLFSDALIADPDLLLNTCQVSGVGAGSSQTISCAFTRPGEMRIGSWFVGAVADSEDTVPESDESNNTEHDWHLRLIEEGPPDLVVSSVDCPVSATSPGAITCSVRISNQGDGFASSISSEMRLSQFTNATTLDPLLGTCDRFSLPAGSSTTINCDGAIPGGIFGSRNVVIIIGNPAFTPESNGDNNTGYASIRIDPGPVDLVVSSVECPRSATSPGEISCSVRISNQGGSHASSFGIEMRLSRDANIASFGSRIGACDGPSLFAGQSQTITCSGSIPAGQTGVQYVGVIADSPSRVSESNENNNTGHATVSLQQGLADLVVSSVDCPQSATSPGEIRCTARIGNQGGGPAGSFSTAMYLSRVPSNFSLGASIGSCDSPFSIPAGGSQVVTCRGTIPMGHAGVEYVGVIADSSSRVNESSENNNTGYDSISLTGGSPFP
ncbi:CARDB domain-containing protein [Sorangium sp. So ce204]|uniref:CARDB domain-containing protein n=1 Tax=Sorangium sp. So ce204 TaxID=3133288 RepID=UPI003F624131